MGSVFKEQIVKRQSTIKDTLLRVGLVVAAALISIIAITSGLDFIGPLIAVASMFGAWFLMSFLKVEYEYAFTDGELDIDVIYNRSRRKRVFSARVNDFEIMAHVDDKMHKGSFDGAQEVRDYSSGVTTDNTYAFILNHNSKRVKVIIEPNEMMLKAIASVLTRRKLHIKM